MRMSRAAALLTCTTLLLPVTACGRPATPAPNVRPTGAYLYGSDGNMSNPFGAASVFEQKPGAILGMKGTRPATQLSEEFQARLRVEDPSLTDFNYAGEAYDAVMIAALATQVAGTTDPSIVKQHLVGVTVGPEPCRTIADCMAIAKSRGDVAYRGITIRSGFTDAGEPSTTSYGTFHFGQANQLDNSKTEYLRAGNEALASTAAHKANAAGKNGAPLIIGGLMTLLSSTNKARYAGARMAVKELNAANVGGVLGMPVVWKEGSDGAKNEDALKQINDHKAAGVHVLIGTSGSALAAAMIPEIVSRRMIMISPSNTSAALSKVDDQGFYFRTAPSDVLQARALADMIMRDGGRRVTLIGVKGAYGEGLINGVKTELAAAGMNEANIQLLVYEADGNKVKDPAAVAGIAQQANGFKPDGVLVAGTVESAEVVRALIDTKLEIRH